MGSFWAYRGSKQPVVENVERTPSKKEKKERLDTFDTGIYSFTLLVFSCLHIQWVTHLFGPNIVP